MTTQIIQNGDGQSVRLPSGFEFSTPEVAIRREGESVILEPIKGRKWPFGFFERIRIDDSEFQRPEQGSTPAIEKLDAAP
jgi:virulence-associated protein VagC